MASPSAWEPLNPIDPCCAGLTAKRLYRLVLPINSATWIEALLAYPSSSPARLELTEAALVPSEEDAIPSCRPGGSVGSAAGSGLKPCRADGTAT